MYHSWAQSQTLARQTGGIKLLKVGAVAPSILKHPLRFISVGVNVGGLRIVNANLVVSIV